MAVTHFCLTLLICNRDQMCTPVSRAMMGYVELIPTKMIPQHLYRTTIGASYVFL